MMKLKKKYINEKKKKCCVDILNKSILTVKHLC